MKIDSCNDRQVFRLLADEAQQRGARFESCLDVGCRMNPVVDWFRRFTRQEDSLYYATDSHPGVKETLSKRGIEVMFPDKVPSLFKADLVIAQEVLEHVPIKDVPDFLRQLKAWTDKALALTCPNFSGYDVNGKVAQDKELRFIPDHLRNFDPRSTDPNMHKTATTPDFVAQNLADIFPQPEWSVQVHRAWPWVISDISVGRAYQIYFKVFALVWRN